MNGVTNQDNAIIEKLNPVLPAASRTDTLLVEPDRPELTAMAKAEGVYIHRFTAFEPELNSDVRTLLNQLGASTRIFPEERL